MKITVIDTYLEDRLLTKLGQLRAVQMILVTAQRDILDRGPRMLARHIVELVLSSHN